MNRICIFMQVKWLLCRNSCFYPLQKLLNVHIYAYFIHLNVWISGYLADDLEGQVARSRVPDKDTRAKVSRWFDRDSR